MPKSLSFIHKLSKNRGLHYLIPIIKELFKVHTNIIILIIGNGPDKEEFKKIAEENEVSNYFKILGNIPNKDIWKYYKISDIFLMPSDVEGFPRVIIEAMASGTPFVSTLAGGVGDIITKENVDDPGLWGNIEIE